MAFARCFILFICLSIGHELLAQLAPAGNQIISYDDGSVFMGEVVYSSQDEIVLLANTGDSLHLKTDRIRRIKTVKDDVALRSRGKYLYKSGVFLGLSSGYSFTADESAQLELLIGYRMDDRTSVGIGVGTNVNSKSGTGFWSENYFAPVFIHGRRYFGGGNVAPFIFGNVGYGLATRSDFWNDYTSGFYAQPGLGFQFASRGKFRFTTALSGYFQHTKGTRQMTDSFFGTPIDIDYSIWYSRLMLRVGVEFR